jgi:2-methylcitrate dehydratase
MSSHILAFPSGRSLAGPSHGVNAGLVFRSPLHSATVTPDTAMSDSPHGTDATLERLSDYACRLRYDDISAEALHQVKRTLIDTLGCGAGAFDEEPAAIARRTAGRVQGNPGARILGTSQCTSMDLAAFANTVLVRYLDCNDTYAAARGTGHPSDMIPAVLAVADGRRASGRAAITAITLAYEVFCRVADEVPLKGWDQGMFVAIGAACGAGKILGLDRAAMGHAISIAITTGIPLGVTRVGELSMWKGCATAAAVRTGVFAAELAAEGMTGPGHPFGGRDGLWQHLGIDAPAWSRFGGAGEPFRITRTSFKAYPAVVHTQGPIGLVLELRSQLAATDIASVRVATYGEAVRRTATEAEKWDPQTRETADHSIPYLVAVALQDGAVSPATFTPRRIQDPTLRPVIKKLTVVEEPEFTRRYPAESCTRIEVTTTDGRRLTARTSYPKGHRGNPLTDAEVEAKFRGLAGDALGPNACDRLLAAVWRLEDAATVDELFEGLSVSR